MSNNNSTKFDIVLNADISELKKERLEKQITDLQNTVITLEQNIDKLRQHNDNQAMMILDLQKKTHHYESNSFVKVKTPPKSRPIHDSTGKLIAHQWVDTNTQSHYHIYDPFEKDQFNP
jgi:chromosome segregation ATPase